MVEAVDGPSLEGDDGILGARDVLRAPLRATARDVAVADAVALLQVLQPVTRVERMHFEGRVVEKKPRSDESLVQMMVTQDVADVLAQEAFDALPELLHAIDVRLRHPPGAIRG